MRVNHTLEPFYDKKSKILILGTIPSPKSREYGFYYMHPRNRFWRVLADIFEEPYPDTQKNKTSFLTRHHIALWDVLDSCDIKGASDSSITNPKPNNIRSLVDKTDIKQVFVTGKKALDLYNRFILDDVKITPIYLPSTSPANQTITYEELKEKYKKINDYL